MGALDRYIRRHGRDATLHEVVESGEDEWKDSTSANETTTSTSAIVRLQGEAVTVTVAGEKVEIDAEVLVPSDLSVDPEANDSRPWITVGGEDYKIWAVDEEGQQFVDGGKRLLATRR